MAHRRNTADKVGKAMTNRYLLQKREQPLEAVRDLQQRRSLELKD